LHTSLLEKWELKIISKRKLKQQDITAESLSLGRTQRMNRNTAGTHFNMLEKAATDSKLSDLPGNIFSIDEIGVHINNKPESVKNVSSVPEILRTYSFSNFFYR
jgi:hypothetical protein